MNRTNSRSFPVRTCLLALAAAASPAMAYLGSFRPADGYTLSVPSGGPASWCDVSYYNAGQWGANAGGAPNPFNVTPNAGLWKLDATSQVGAFFTTSAARNASTPPTLTNYPTTVPSNTAPVYIVGDHSPGRFFDGGALAVRNDTPAGTGAMSYSYNLDTYDTGGPVPSSVTSGNVGVKFYYQASPEQPPIAGTRAPDKFTMSFRDSVGNTGLQWGYTRDNEVVWRNSAIWNYTGIYAGNYPTNWDGVSASIDLTSGTFKLEYYIDASSTWVTLAAAGTPLANPMGNFTNLGWKMEDAVNLGLGGKNFFDDFSFSIPAPGPMALLGLGGLIAGTRRRR